MLITGTQKEEEDIFEKLMFKFLFFKFVFSGRINEKKTTSGYIIVKFLRTVVKKNILKQPEWDVGRHHREEK